MLLYYITARQQFAGSEAARRNRLLEKIAEAACCGVDFIQLREKDLSSRDLETLACDAIRAICSLSPKTAHGEPKTALLINSRTDIALAAGAHGVHLRSDDISPSDVRAIWHSRGGRSLPVIAVSCHSLHDVARAAAQRADFAVLAPIFEKAGQHPRPAGLDLLRQACRENIPVLALGGITLANAQSCVDAGAAGIAAIRLFQDNDISRVVQNLRPAP